MGVAVIAALREYSAKNDIASFALHTPRVPTTEKHDIKRHLNAVELSFGRTNVCYDEVNMDTLVTFVEPNIAHKQPRHNVMLDLLRPGPAPLA
jgi:hypothetical protein